MYRITKNWTPRLGIVVLAMLSWGAKADSPRIPFAGIGACMRQYKLYDIDEKSEPRVIDGLMDALARKDWQCAESERPRVTCRRKIAGKERGATDEIWRSALVCNEHLEYAYVAFYSLESEGKHSSGAFRFQVGGPPIEDSFN